jgi:hypothetical protein
MNTFMEDLQGKNLACPICRSAHLTYTRLNKSYRLAEFTCLDCGVVWEKILGENGVALNDLNGLILKGKQGGYH